MASDQSKEHVTANPQVRSGLAVPHFRLLIAGTGALLFGLAGWWIFNRSEDPRVAPDPESPIVCREAVWDFGTIDQDKQADLSHIFKLENVSAKSIRVVNMDVRCGCVVPDRALAELQASSTTDFSVGMRPGGRPAGPFQTLVNLTFETSPPKTITMTIKGTIPPNPALYLVPSNLSFGTVTDNETASRTIKIARYNGAPVDFISANAESEAIRIEEVTQGDSAHSFVEMTIKLDGSKLKPGDFDSSIAVQTKHPMFGDLRVFASAKVVPKSFGFVASLFIDRLTKDGVVDKGLAELGQSPPIVRGLRFEGDRSINVRLIRQPHPETKQMVPMVRVSRGEGVTKNNTIARGNLIMELVGHKDRLRIPVAAYLCD